MASSSRFKKRTSITSRKAGTGRQVTPPKKIRRKGPVKGPDFEAISREGPRQVQTDNELILESASIADTPRETIPNVPGAILEHTDSDSEYGEQLLTALARWKVNDNEDEPPESDSETIPEFEVLARSPSPTVGPECIVKMASGLPSPTSRDSPKWDGEVKNLRQWLRQLEILYTHHGETNGKNKVQHALGCITDCDLAEEFEVFAESKAEDWNKFKKRILMEYDLDEVEKNGSVSKLEKIVATYRPIPVGEYREWKKFKLEFNKEAEQCKKSKNGTLISNRSLVGLLSEVLHNSLREKVDTQLTMMDMVKKDTAEKRPREDPYKLEEVIIVVDKIMSLSPLGGSAFMQTPTTESKSIIRHEVIERSILNETRITMAQIVEEWDSMKKEFMSLLQGMQLAQTIPQPSQVYRPSPLNSWHQPMTYQFQGPAVQISGYGGYSENSNQIDCWYCGNCLEQMMNCRVRAKDIQDGIVCEGPGGRLVMGGSGMKIEHILQMKESEVHATGVDKGKAPAVMMQSTQLEGEPPLQLLQELGHYSGWFKAQNFASPEKASTSQPLRTRTSKETVPNPYF
ncbi:hypothetical protein BDQ17DRAFT_1332254 [Cyathus striatus]|nr:hypothetical protein BDQ17DRAFT_1332254 [Cyathus striatus]